MYPHHAKAIGQFVDHFAPQPGVIAVILDGSVAQGRERIDSDIDGIIIVDQEYYDRQKEKNALAEIIEGICNYEGGYFDVKYFTKAMLSAVAESGSEPARNTFIKSRVLHTADDEIPGIVARIPVFQKDEKQEKLAVFFADLSMNHWYYWPMQDKSPYLAIHAAGEIVYAAYRMILQENEILFACNRELEEQVAGAPNKPEGIVELANEFLAQLDDKSEKRFVGALLGWTSYKPESEGLIQSKYLEYYEQWWRSKGPFVNEW